MGPSEQNPIFRGKLLIRLVALRYAVTLERLESAVKNNYRERLIVSEGMIDGPSRDHLTAIKTSRPLEKRPAKLKMTSTRIEGADNFIKLTHRSAMPFAFPLKNPASFVLEMFW